MPTMCVVLPAADRAQLAHVVANGNTNAANLAKCENRS